MPKRKSRTPKQKLAIFERHGGICHICGVKIDGTRERWDLDHIIALAVSYDDSEDNLAPAHIDCHKSKTREDVKSIAKSNRVRAKHQGAWRKKKSPLPAGKGSKWKKTIDGRVVLRD